MNETAQNPVTVAVLMTCFNRREATLSCLDRLYAQTGREGFQLSVFLVDDGSTDGTAGAVNTLFPAVQIMTGTGDLYWNGGMRVAFAGAFLKDPDFFLWLNDDTDLFPAAVQTLLDAHRELDKAGICAIVTGSTCDRVTGRRSYGGQRWQTGSRRRLIAVDPHIREVLPCDTMNGNCTLVSRRVAREVGNLDAIFQHSFGDLDYGFRARAAGFAVYVAPGFVGYCSDNSRRGTWRDESIPFRLRWKHLTSAKGSPFVEWSLYCKRHLGPFWPLYAVSPYVKTVATSLYGVFTS